MSADVGRTLFRRIIPTLLHARDLYSGAFVEPFEAAENDLDRPLLLGLLYLLPLSLCTAYGSKTSYE